MHQFQTGKYCKAVTHIINRIYLIRKINQKSRIAQDKDCVAPIITRVYLPYKKWVM